MAITKCPGFDPSLWRDKDIVEVPCPNCAQDLEFWKDDLFLTCPGCGEDIENPMKTTTEDSEQ